MHSPPTACPAPTAIKQVHFHQVGMSHTASERWQMTLTIYILSVSLSRRHTETYPAENKSRPATSSEDRIR